MSLAVDAMGGDRAPREIVLGAVEAAPEIPGSIILVGDPAQIEAYLPDPAPPNVLIRPASQVIEMHERPVDALRRKKDASIVVCAALVKDGQAQAMVSAGNTGAAAAAALLSWRTIPGVHRPAIGSLIPNSHGGFMLIDAGASPDVDPEHLVEFALMGRAYMRKVVGRESPKVYLLNIGEEEGKGNAFAKQAYHLLAQFDWFAGNIEGKDVFRHPVDVVVCDAFVGNIVLKTGEGVAEYVMHVIRSSLPDHPLAKLALLPAKSLFDRVKKRLDYAEYGGSPLLGLNGLCVICHGRSNAKAIKNAIREAQRAVEHNVIEAIRESFHDGRR